MTFWRVLHIGPMERAIRDLWRQYEKMPVRAWRHFWRLLRLHREFDLTPPVRDWPSSFPVGRKPACFRCTENCCVGAKNTVLLRLVDVALFVDKGWTEHFTFTKPVFSDELLKQKPSLQEMVKSFHWRTFPVLKQQPNGHCVLLDEAGRCTIHAWRPWVCRAYPYVLDIAQKQVHWSGGCKVHDDADANDADARELWEATFHNIYDEKIRDLLLATVYREELEKIGIARWLRLDGV